MTTFLCIMSSSLPSSTRFHGPALHSSFSTLTLSSHKVARSSIFGSSSRVHILSTASDSATTRSYPLISASARLEQETSKRSSRVEAAGDDASLSPGNTRGDAAAAAAGEEASESFPSRVTGANVKSWKATRATRKTTRRRAMAICLALASLGQRGSSSSGLEQNQSSASQAKDLISVSQSTAGVSAPVLSPASWEGYGDLVTVSTGSDSSNNEEGMESHRGEDFRVRVPFGWIESTSEIATGSVLRYEDKTDPSTNVIVLKSPTSQSQTADLGDPENWIREQAYLLTGSNEPLSFQTGEEGADANRKFPTGRISIAKVLSVDKPKNKQGLMYYNYEIITKQGGGEQTDELHELVAAVVNDGNLYLCRVQTGEDRWQENSQSMAQRIVDSFQITGFRIHV